jgi:uncharacterized membrane protein
MEGCQGREQPMVPHQYLVLWLSGWALIFVAVPAGLSFLLNLLPWMIASPLPSMVLAIPLALWVYLPVPPLVQAGVFDGWKGTFMVVGCEIFSLAGVGALLLLHLPIEFLIPLAALSFVPLIVVALQMKAERHQIS